jgi:hypothetical protein
MLGGNDASPKLTPGGTGPTEVVQSQGGAPNAPTDFRLFELEEI